MGHSGFRINVKANLHIPSILLAGRAAQGRRAPFALSTAAASLGIYVDALIASSASLGLIHFRDWLRQKF